MKKIDLQYNIDAHNKYARKYDKRHPENFNEIEQARLHDSVKNSLNYVKTGSKEITVFDMGCGTGNLTHHFLSCGVKVVSADISTEFLNIIKEKFSVNPNSSTFQLNGEDLREISDNTYDVIGLFSVIHHIQDYFTVLKEASRILKPGGIIYIDHERNDNFYDDNSTYTEFYKQVPKKINWLYYFNVFNPKWYVKKYNKIKNPRWQAEGDIHVWKDDHIEWNKLDKMFIDLGFEIPYKLDYLSFIPGYPMELYKKYQDKASDMRCVIYRKTS